MAQCANCGTAIDPTDPHYARWDKTEHEPYEHQRFCDEGCREEWADEGDSQYSAGYVAPAVEEYSYSISVTDDEE